MEAAKKKQKNKAVARALISLNRGVLTLHTASDLCKGSRKSTEGPGDTHLAVRTGDLHNPNMRK